MFQAFPYDVRFDSRRRWISASLRRFPEKLLGMQPPNFSTGEGALGTPSSSDEDETGWPPNSIGGSTGAVIEATNLVAMPSRDLRPPSCSPRISIKFPLILAQRAVVPSLFVCFGRRCVEGVMPAAERGPDAPRTLASPNVPTRFFLVLALSAFNIGPFSEQKVFEVAQFPPAARRDV